MGAHHLPHAPGRGFIGRPAVDGGRGFQHPPAGRLPRRIANRARGRGRKPFAPRTDAVGLGQPPVEIMSFEADQRLGAALDERVCPAARFDLGNGKQNGGL